MNKETLRQIRDEYWDASVEVDEVLLAHWAIERGGSLLEYITQLEAELEGARGEIEILSQGEATTMLVDRLIKLGWRPPNIITRFEEFWRQLKSKWVR